MNNFFLVWEPTSGYTRYKHQCFNDAKIEAERLARENRDKEFYVLEAKTVSKVDYPVHTEQLNDVPF